MEKVFKVIVHGSTEELTADKLAECVRGMMGLKCSAKKNTSGSFTLELPENQRFGSGELSACLKAYNISASALEVNKESSSLQEPVEAPEEPSADEVSFVVEEKDMPRRVKPDVIEDSGLASVDMD